jgi:hypothetical protein
VGDINVIYCAKDTQKLYLWSGSAYTEVFPSQALLDTYQLRSEKGNANGYASLDSLGKVPISQLPSSLMEYKGTWNAATNTPTLANGTGDTGDVYICNVAGSVNFGAGAITFAVGDYVIYSGTIWQRSSGAVGTVTSVAASITGNSIGITGSPITTSGTLALAFAGTSAQYINGAGNLITFPTSLISGSGASGQVTFFNGANSVTGTNNFFWDATNNRLGIGTTTPQRSIEIFNSTADNHLRLSGNAPSVSMGEAVTGSIYQAKFGLVTTNGQFAAAGVAGDFVIISQTGATIFVTNSTEKMRVNASGNMSVGNTNDTYRLDVTGTARLTGQLRLESTITNGTYTYTLPSATGTLALTSDIPSLTGYVPYTGATANVDLGAFTLIAARGTFSSSGSSDTVGITHSSGSGIALNITKGGNGEGLYINKTSGSGNAATIIGTLNATTLVKSGGTSSQFLKADGSVDSTSYGTGSVTSVGLSSATSGVTIGSTPITTSGTITLAIATASGSQQGLLSSTDWTTFNNKQNALTNPVTGTGTTNYLPKFTGASTIGDSSISDVASSPLSIVKNASSSTSNLIFISPTTGTNASILNLDNAGAGSFYIGRQNSAGASVLLSGLGAYASVVGHTGSQTLHLVTNSLSRVQIDGSGNLGLGVTPSAWFSGLKAIQFGTAGVLWSNLDRATIGANVYVDASTIPTYINNGFALRYSQESGSHIWYTAPSGTAGNAISFTQAMTLNASGNLSIGNTNDTYKLDVSGTGRFTNGSTGFAINATSNWTSSASNNPIITFGRAGSAVAGAIGYDDNLGSLYIGTTTNHNFLVKTNNAVALTIASTGAATFSSSVTALRYISQGSSAYNNDFLSTDIGTPGSYVGLRFGYDGSSYNKGALYFLSKSGNGVGDFVFALNNSESSSNVSTSDERMRITASGNVAIGTTSPSAKLFINTGGVGSTSNGIGIDNGAQQHFWYLSDNTTSTYQINSGSGVFRWVNSNGELMRITSAGNVGIGTTSPQVELHVKGNNGWGELRVEGQSFSGGNGGAVEFYSEGTALADIYSDTTKNLIFRTNGSTERMRITSGGNVGIGTTSPVAKLDVTSSSGVIASFVGASGNYAQIYSDANAAVFGASTTTSLGNNYLYINPSSNFQAFITNGAERMRITSGGDLCVGTTSTSNGCLINFYKASGSITTILGGTTSAQNHIVFANPNGNVGSIQVSGSATSYNTSSDYRLKQDFKDFNGLDLLTKIKTYDYEWKADNSRSYGVIAHELQSVINYAVTGVKDGKEMQGVDYSKIVPVLIKAIQEQQTQIEQLKNK